MPLTDTFVRTAKPDAKARKYSDAGGLYLFMPPSGSKLWRLAYSFGGKQKTLALGIYPAISLAAARKARDAAKELLAQGTDPGRQRKIDRLRSAEAAGNRSESFDQLWPGASARRALRLNSRNSRHNAHQGTTSDTPPGWRRL